MSAPEDSDRPWVLLDLNGTLLDPGSIAVAVDGVDDPHRLMTDAFDEALLHTMADTLSGAYRALPEYLRASLERRLILAGAYGGRLDEVMDRASAMEAFPEASDALDVLTDAGIRLVVLTNSPTAGADAALTAAGLRKRFSAVIGSDAGAVLQAPPGCLPARPA